MNTHTTQTHIKMMSQYATDDSLAFRRKEILRVVAMWVNSEDTVLNEISQIQKDYT